MFKFCVFLAFCVSSCFAAPGGGGTNCGETPSTILDCISTPKTIDADVFIKCSFGRYSNECDRQTCLYRESAWLDGTAVDKPKVTAYFEEYEKNHAEWAPAIQHLKTACLGSELKAQGVYLNCPAYDVTQCLFGSFIKYAAPSQWSNSSSCESSRAYAAACPVCPSECFSPQVPSGSCNACHSQPTTP